jgi:hypothetical protein
MNLEIIPVVVGAAVALLGFGLLVDAWAADGVVLKERRRTPRVERSRKGEAMVGLGVLCMGAAFMGRDTWVYSVASVIAGSVLVALGAIVNRRYLREIIGNRGSLRRRDRY